MSSNSHRPGTSKLGQGASQATVANNQTLLLEKVNARTSTPDSEALASSEDEADHRPELAYAPHPKPVRRSSWLNDTSQPLARPRKGSFASTSMSPTASHPTTPSAESTAGPWGSHSASSAMGRGPNNFPWGTGIWNAERKEAPTRFSEVLPSPTSTVPPGGGGHSFFGPGDNMMQTSPSREPGTNPQIPFAIPLHPTPKTYRSQSYSVGQLDNDGNNPQGNSHPATIGRARHPALQHRPSRPSMLSEMSNDGSVLGKVQEAEDDDDESVSSSLQNSLHQSSADSKTIEMLTRENAMLRQQQFNARLRPRASTGVPYLGNGYQLQEAVPEESDYAVDELDGEQESGDSFAKRATSRRMSEYAAGTGPLRSPFGGDNRKADSSTLKRALWSSSLGFAGGDVSQSRRHSFANMPTRQGSISSLADANAGLEALMPDGQMNQDLGSMYAENMGYVGNVPAYLPSLQPMGNPLQPGFSTAYPSAYGLQNPFANRAPSPHRNLYSGMAQPRHNQLLHIVLFKCARADVFYIQEGTGLTVKPGDLVIVEADRGTDLGTVAKDNVDWQSAKDLKEHYAEEQYKWLMMYSQGAAAAQEGSGAGLLASSGGIQGSAIGGMGPPTQHHMQEPNPGELRPKLIKRLAQSHEVHALRDKEGQEAKAKRVCMQKVKEHGLNMEILDAEFQMDWKKLTFYYFADAYINFNSLVTDLFKIYKTRIWMSAINPASFASPTLGIQAPSGVGPGAVNVSRNSGANDRRQPPPQHQPQQSQETPTQQAFGLPPQAGRGFRQPYTQPFTAERSVPTGPVHGQPNYGFGQPGGFGVGRGNMGYAPSPNMDGYNPIGFQQADFQSMRNRYPTPGSATSPAPPHSQGMSPISPSNDWTGGFQGLSLNTH